MTKINRSNTMKEPGGSFGGDPGGEAFASDPGILDDDFDPESFFGGDILPPVPNKPGFHRTWVRVASDKLKDPNNHIAMLRWGYRPVDPSEMYCGDQYRINDGKYVGAFGVQDVILMEIPVVRYNKIRSMLDARADAADAQLYDLPPGMRDGATEAQVTRRSRVLNRYPGSNQPTGGAVDFD